MTDETTETTEPKTAVERLLGELRVKAESEDSEIRGAFELIAGDLAAAIELDKADIADAVDPVVARMAVDHAGEAERKRVLGVLNPRLGRLRVQAAKLSGEAERTMRAQIAALEDAVREIGYEPPADAADIVIPDVSGKALGVMPIDIDPPEDD